MPKKSFRSVEERYRSGSVRVFALDREGVLARLRERARALVKADASVIEVRLFGSLARRDAGPGSDADLLILVDRSTASPLERVAAYARAFEGVGIGCDLVVHTLEEQRQLAERRSRFSQVVAAEGMTLAHR